MSILHRVEEHDKYVDLPSVDEHPGVLHISFDTEYRGIWQCGFDTDGIDEYLSEPPFETLPEEEQKEVKRIGAVVFYYTFGEVPEDLNI